MSVLTSAQKVQIAQAAVSFVDSLLADGFDRDDIRRWVAYALEDNREERTDEQL